MLFGQSGTERGFSRMDLLDNNRVISSSDRLKYQVLEEQSTAVILNSDSEGMIKFPPLLQSMMVTGKTCYELAKEVKTRLEVDFFYRATVTIEVTQASFREFATIYGQVKTQGRIALPANGQLTISQAISLVGGSLDGADLKKVTILRKNSEDPEKEDRITVNVDDIINAGKIENDVRIFGNDTIIIHKNEEMGSRYSVLGAVKSPGLYTIQEEDLSVSDAILLAGGFNEVARDKRVKLTRRIDGSDESEIIYINVKRILQDGIRSEDVLLKEDDIIYVSERLIVF